MKTFFMQRIPDLYQYSLRRHAGSEPGKPRPPCVNGSYHDGMFLLGWDSAQFCPHVSKDGPCTGDIWPHDDPDWPKSCKCGYVFQPDDGWQFFVDHMYERFDTKQRMPQRDFPVGAMWFADWYTWAAEGSCDGRVLLVRLPGNHDWSPEFRANNCTSPCKHCAKPYHAHKNTKGETSGRCQPTWTYNDGNPHYEDARPHKCWVRHGTPPGQTVHVDKNGVTCEAGAGSIAIDGWHGFLHNGELTG